MFPEWGQLARNRALCCCNGQEVVVIERIYALFMARNKEFVRDKSSLGWSILFPFLVIAGFSLMFSGRVSHSHKVAVIHGSAQTTAERSRVIENFLDTLLIESVALNDAQDALRKLKHHSLDMVLNPETGEYWISDSSPGSYVAEKMLHAAENDGPFLFTRKTVQGREIPYVEWLFPGILGMNMMFSGLFGVGFVVVHYRKNGVLKRLSASPMRAYEYLVSQVLSRVVIMFCTTAVVYTGCNLLYDFTCRGSYLLLILVFLLGSFSMISMGLLVAARISSEELAGGLLNLISWPMMFLSGVWFSLEGTKPWVKTFSQIFPLTHLIESARLVMNEGAGFYDIRYKLLVLFFMSFVFLTAGSLIFEWKKR